MERVFLDPLEGECGWLTPGKGFGRGGGSRTPLLFPEGWSGPETSALPPPPGALLALSCRPFGREVAVSFALALLREESPKIPGKESFGRGGARGLPGAPSPERIAPLRAPSRAPRARARPSGSPRRRPGPGRGLQSQAALASELRRQCLTNLPLHPRPPGPVPPLAVASD